MLFEAALVLALAPSSGEWPGLPPDCWSRPRLVHREEHWRDHDAHVRVRRVAPSSPRQKVASPNGGYWLAWISDRPESTVAVYAEKEHQIEIDFLDQQGIEEPVWINEKLIFLRVWWGRIAATDFIFDVEGERFVHSESLVDGRQAMTQFREGCRTQGGCRCVDKEM